MILWNLIPPIPTDNSINFLFRNYFLFHYLKAYHQGISLSIVILILSLIRCNYYWNTKAVFSSPIWPYLHEIIQRREFFSYFILVYKNREACSELFFIDHWIKWNASFDVSNCFRRYFICMSCCFLFWPCKQLTTVHLLLFFVKVIAVLIN